jgi:hypothetical protein
MLLKVSLFKWGMKAITETFRFNKEEERRWHKEVVVALPAVRF